MRTRACGVCLRNGRVLLQRKRDEAIWALPGGKVEQGETPAAALVREWQEELGILPVIGRTLWVFENHFEHRGAIVEQTEFYFEVIAAADGVSPYTESQARDESLIFGWFAPEDLQQLDVRPAAVVERLFP
jgi:mutator protein MutT